MHVILHIQGGMVNISVSNVTVQIYSTVKCGYSTLRYSEVSVKVEYTENWNIRNFSLTKPFVI